MLKNLYRENLRKSVSASAAPYGYTLTTWTAGSIITHSQGTPTAVDALLFMAGAVLGFALVGTLAFGGVAGRPANGSGAAPPIWTSFHFPSIALAIGAVSLVVWALNGVAAWPLGAFFSTAIYLLVAGVEKTVAGGPPPKTPPD